MRVRKVKRRCEVRGCKNLNTYSITKGNQFGNSILICEDCLREALEAIEAIKAKKNEAKVAAEVEEPVVEPVEEPAEETTADVPEEKVVAKVEVPAVEGVDDLVFRCTKCGKEYKTESGLINHMKKCQAE